MGGLTSWLVPNPLTAGPGCETVVDGVLREPVSAVSSLAFVVAGAVLVVAARRDRQGRRGRSSHDEPASSRSRSVVGYGILVAGIGLGSVAQHGPDPWWADLAHDLPLIATLAFVTADAVADLVGRPRAWWWWAVPTVALVSLIHAAPQAGDVTQGVVAGIAVASSLVRARARPGLRRPIGWALGLLAIGGLTGTLSDAGAPLCVPGSLWHGHAVWHVLASVALVILAPAIGTSGSSPRPMQAPFADARG